MSSTKNIIMQQTPPDKKETGGKTGFKMYIFIALAVLVVLFTLAVSFLVVTKMNETRKAEIVTIVEEFEWEMRNCMDYSVILDGGKIDLNPLVKYFYVQEYAAEQLNEWALFMTDKHNSIGEFVVLTDSILSGTVANIPFVGNKLSELIIDGYKKDALFNEDVWRNFADIRVSPVDIEILNRNNALVTLSVTVEFDYESFNDSLLLKAMELVNIDYFPNDISAKTTEMTLKMIKDTTSRKWLFTDDFFQYSMELLPIE